MLEKLDINRFLTDHWQKQPLFMPAALGPELPQLSPDDLAWLATQPDVESRLIFTDRDGADVRYRVLTGPFDEQTLSGLPEQDWTLLIQDVEKHLPDFRRYLQQVGFVPDWRIDDLMVSCAAPGGSVGPHVDNYDVFLCQGDGTRKWTVGSVGQYEIDPTSEGLSLIRPFGISGTHDADRGDVLYLPPGVPHWGIASDLCVTYSIGCRAPTQRELELGQERLFERPVDESSGSGDQVFYTDPDLLPTESPPGGIHPATLRRIREQHILEASLSDIDLARILGCVVTDPKAWLDPEPVAGEDLLRTLQESGDIPVHGMAHIAWIDLGKEKFVFANGADCTVNGEALQLVQRLCEERQLLAKYGQGLNIRRPPPDIVTWLAEHGLFDGSHDQE
jgi:50S ribosomal protein L16 3-hydroxylase